jgi:hypothetical protein
MNKREYRKALESARSEFDKLLGERLSLEKRILSLRQTIAGLVALCEGEGKLGDLEEGIPFPRSIKLTSAIRQVLAEGDTPISPPELRNTLIRRGLDMSNYANQLSVVHNTLIRLQRQGQAVQVSGAWVLTDKGKLASKMDFIESPLSRRARKR